MSEPSEVSEAHQSSERDTRRCVPHTLLAAVVLVGGTAPVALYWLLFGSTPTILPDEARQLLREPLSAAVLVDVRAPEAFAAGHLDGAVNWPLERVLAATRPEGIPASLRGKTLLFLCDVGVASRCAVWHVQQLGVDSAFNVRGGIQEWMRSAVREGDALGRWQIGTDPPVELPFRESPMHQQAAAVLSFFYIKSIYTLLSLVVVVVLWTTRSSDAVALRWAMIFFFLGENVCALNYFAFKETSYLSEYLHSLGMALCFAFAAYALLEGIDRRILGLSDPKRRCAAIGLCGQCIKYANVPCGLKRTFYLLIPAVMVIALMLPTADWQDNSYSTRIFGQLYHYGHLRVYQQLENWYCAGAALVAFGVSVLILALKKEDAIAPAKTAFAAGVGPLAFGMMRMVLGGAYDQNRAWYLFWEETTEFVFIFGICCLLLIFTRRQRSPGTP